MGRFFTWGGSGSSATSAPAGPSSQPASVLHLVPGTAAAGQLLLLALTADALDCWQASARLSLPPPMPYVGPSWRAYL